MLLAVHHIGACGAPPAGLREGFFYPVLNGFHFRAGLARQPGQHQVGQRLGQGGVKFAAGLASGSQRTDDITTVERNHTAVALADTLHVTHSRSR